MEPLTERISRSYPLIYITDCTSGRAGSVSGVKGSSTGGFWAHGWVGLV